MAAVLPTGLGGYLKEQRQQAKMSLRQLADVAGVSNPYLSQVERGLRKPSAEVLQQIAKGLRISAEALYVQAGFLEERGDQVHVEAAILADPLLNERQRRVLLDIYQTFRLENERNEQVPAEQSAARTAKAAAKSAPAKTTAKTTTRTTAKKSPARKAAAKATTSEAATGKTSAKAAAKPAAKATTKKVAAKRTTAPQSAASQAATDQNA